jgi:hypothetical protein
MDPLTIASLIGTAGQGLMSVLGANSAAANAVKQQNKINLFNVNQNALFDTGAKGLEATAMGMPTYQADMRGYNAMTDQANQNYAQAQGSTRNALDQYQLDQADQGFANMVQASGKLGLSKADMAAQLLGGQQLAGAQKAKSISESQQYSLGNIAQARQMQLAALGQSAAGGAMESYRQYASQAARQQGILGVQQANLSGKMNLGLQGMQLDLSAAGIVDKANQSYYLGAGGALGGMSSGLLAMGMQQMKMDQLAKMYANNKGGLATKDFTGMQDYINTPNMTPGSLPSLVPSNLPTMDASNAIFNA